MPERRKTNVQAVEVGRYGKRRKGTYVGGKKREAADYQSRYAVFWNAKHIWVYQ